MFNNLEMPVVVLVSPARCRQGPCSDPVLLPKIF